MVDATINLLADLQFTDPSGEQPAVPPLPDLEQAIKDAEEIGFDSEIVKEARMALIAEHKESARASLSAAQRNRDAQGLRKSIVFAKSVGLDRQSILQAEKILQEEESLPRRTPRYLGQA